MNFVKESRILQIVYVFINPVKKKKKKTSLPPFKVMLQEFLYKLPGSVADIMAPNRRQSVRKKSPSAAWPNSTVSLVKP